MKPQIIPFMIAMFFIVFTTPQHLEAKQSLKLESYPIIIACKNTKTNEFVKPKNKSVEDGGCLIGKNMKNVLLPSKDQMKLMKEVFKDRDAIITAITLMNHESQFNAKAKGCHKKGCDIGLFQIRDIYGWAKKTQKEQMIWFRDRKAAQIKGNCSHRVEEWQEATLRCIFARHRGDLSGQAKYPTDRLNDWKFYKEYLKDFSF